MPIYEYACERGHRFEELQPMGAGAPRCPCGADSRRRPSRVSLTGQAHVGPGPADAPTTWEGTAGGDREVVGRWRRALDDHARLAEAHPELREERRPVLAHEGPFAAAPLRAGDPLPASPPDPGAPAGS